MFHPSLRRGLEIAFAVLIGWAGLCPRPARAGDTVITFDSLKPPAVGTPLANQYQDRGVVFNQGIVFAAASAPTASNVAVGYASGEFGSPILSGTFSNPHHSFVSMLVENTAADVVTLSA